MSRRPADEMRRLEAVETPAYEAVCAKANEWLVRTGLGPEDLAMRLQPRVAEYTLRVFLYGEYRDHMSGSDPKYLCAIIWPYITSHWPKEEHRSGEKLLDTRGYRTIRACVDGAVRKGKCSLVYGPPSSEKSFALRWLADQLNEGGELRAVYLYCGTNLTAAALAQELAHAARVWVRNLWARRIMRAMLAEFLSLNSPPALLLDEAQHLDINCLELVRELNDRAGCGVVLAGSHNLYTEMLRPQRRSRLEQLLSRTPKRVLLEGMTEDEALTLAARAFGNGKPAKLTDAQKERILKACTVEDKYTPVCAACKAPWPIEPDEVVRRCPKCGGVKTESMFYRSSRRLLHYAEEQRARSLKAVLAGEVA